jgi:hypothetical protein
MADLEALVSNIGRRDRDSRSREDLAKGADDLLDELDLVLADGHDKDGAGSVLQASSNTFLEARIFWVNGRDGAISGVQSRVSRDRYGLVDAIEGDGVSNQPHVAEEEQPCKQDIGFGACKRTE